jgi:hypothetical protein
VHVSQQHGLLKRQRMLLMKQRRRSSSVGRQQQSQVWQPQETFWLCWLQSVVVVCATG